MDFNYITAFRWTCFLLVSYPAFENRNVVDAEILVFCNVTTYVTNSLNETGQITSPEVMNPPKDPDDDYCEMDLYVCRGCRIQLSNITTNSCLSKYALVNPEKNAMLIPITYLASSSGDFSKGGNPLRLAIWKVADDEICRQEGSITIKYRIIPPEATYVKLQGATGQRGFISSPYFPDRYRANGDVVTYQLTHSGSGFIRLIFTDWYMPQNGLIKIYLGGVRSDTNSLTYNNRSVRPVVVSKSRVLLFDFEAALESQLNRQDYIGFKANYEFVADSSWPDKPTIVRNEVLDSAREGEIHFFHHHQDIIDFVWMFPKPLDGIFTHLKLRVDIATSIDSLEIRRGPTSLGIRVSLENMTTPFSIYDESGLYVHLRHIVQRGETLEFSAVFLRDGKYTSELCARQRYYSEYFSCSNKTQCISKQLFCDGIQHCDDGADESGCNSIHASCRYRVICPNETRVTCVKPCDGIDDCEDGSDEVGCPPKNNPTVTKLAESSKLLTTSDAFYMTTSRCDPCISYFFVHHSLTVALLLGKRIYGLL